MKNKELSKNINNYFTASLPKIFQKTYNSKKLSKKILNKLFVPEDKKFVSNLFKCVDEHKQLFAIPKDTEFSKIDFFRLKSLAIDIKKQKGRIKLLPLICTVIFIFLLFIIVISTKNVITKKLVVSTMEKIFNAKCDIQNVNLSFFDSNILIENLAQANKNAPMKNIFEIKKINIDFDLVELIKSKFVIDNIECSNILTNTDRLTSGELPPKKNVVKESELVKYIKQKNEESIKNIKNNFESLFADFDAQKMVEKISTELKTPKIATETKDQANILIDKWKTTPSELKIDYDKFYDSFKNLSNININNIKTNPTLLIKTIDDIDKTVKTGEVLTKKIEQIYIDIQEDNKTIINYSNKLKNAIEHDKIFAQNQINSIKSFKIPDGKQLLGNTLDSIGYTYLGKYYPYLQKICNIAKETKSKNINKQPQETKKNIVTRSKGRFIYFKQDRIPKFLLRKALVSGEHFSFSVKDLSSDMNIYDKPAIFDGYLLINNVKHQGNIVADFRTNSNVDAFTINYTGSGIKLDYDLNKFINAKGIPHLSGTTTASAKLTADEHAQFTISGAINVSDANFTTQSFEPEYASKIYSQALSMLNNVSAKITTGYTQKDNLIFNIDTNLDKQFMTIFSKLINQELSLLKENITNKFNTILQEKTGDANASINQFSNINQNINNMKNKLNEYNNQLKLKLSELKEQKTTELKNSVKEKTNEAAKNALKKLLQ